MGDSFQRAEIAYISDEVDVAVLLVNGQHQFLLGRADLEGMRWFKCGYPGLNGKQVAGDPGEYLEQRLKRSRPSSKTPDRCCRYTAAIGSPDRAVDRLRGTGTVGSVNTALPPASATACCRCPERPRIQRYAASNQAAIAAGMPHAMRARTFRSVASGSSRCVVRPSSSRLSYRLVGNVGIELVRRWPHLR